EDLSPIPLEEMPLNRVLRTGKPQRNVLMADMQLDARLAWLLVSCEPMQWDADGAIDLVVASVRDIAAFKQANDAMELQNGLLRKIAGGKLFGATMQDIAALIRQTFPRVSVAIMKVDDSGRHLRLMAAAGLPEGAQQLLRRVAIGEGEG